MNSKCQLIDLLCQALKGSANMMNLSHLDNPSSDIVGWFEYWLRENNKEPTLENAKEFIAQSDLFTKGTQKQEECDLMKKEFGCLDQNIVKKVCKELVSR